MSQAVDAWLDKVIFAEEQGSVPDTCSSTLKSAAKSAGPTPLYSPTPLEPVPSTATFRVHLQDMKRGVVILKEGDTMLVKASPRKDHWLAKILEIHGPDRVVVRPVDRLEERIRMNPYVFQVHRPVEQGDWVLVAPVEGYEDPDNWVLSQVALVHPYGSIDARVGGAVGDAIDEDDDGIETIGPTEFHLAEGEVPKFRLDW